MTPRTLTALAAVAATVAAVIVVAGPGYEAARVRMHSGAIWLTSVHTGQAVLVDGATAEVKAKVPVAEPGTALSVVQRGGDAYALNQRTGQVRRVDSAAEQASPPVSVLPASDGLVVRPAPDALYMIDVHSGTVASADLRTLASRGEPRRMAGALKPDVVVDGRGRLWALDVTGEVVWLDGDARRRNSAAGGQGRLAITRDQPVVVDPEHGTVALLSPESGAVVQTLRASLRSNDSVTVTGSTERSRVLIANSTRGELITCTFDTGTCAEPVRVGKPGAEFGNPVEIDDHAVVPDHSTGLATVVGLATASVVAQRELFARPTRFELITRDGIVFFNDPDGNTAGVLDLAGDVRTIVKYAEGLEGDTPPIPVPHGQADPVTRAGQRDLRLGVGLPWQPKRTSQLNPPPPAPAPAGFITVSPGNRGEAGTEFELTMTLREPGPATIRWAFGDGTEATGTTVRHRWQPGVFTVRAEAALGIGVKVRADTTITVDPVNAPPSITQLLVRRPNPVIGEPVHFSAGTTAEPDSWTWTVTGPGTPTPEVTARTSEFDHSFRTPGVYTVSLTITRGIRTAQSSRQFTVVQGAVKTWGANAYGETEVPVSARSGVIAIDAGFRHALALKSDGSVIAWGSNEHTQTAVPPEASSGVVAIAAGSLHNLALKADGSVVAWGYNQHGQTDVPPSATRDVIAISAGTGFSVALKANGSVIGWGYDYEGQWTPPPAVASGVTSVASGTGHTIAVKADGSVVAWGGDNSAGELSAPPEAASGVQAAAAGFQCSTVLKTDGSVFAWGNPRWGTPDVPASAKSGVVAIDSRERHSLGLKADGSVIAWGHNGSGEASVPPQYGSGARAVAVGDGFSVVLLDSAPE